MDSCCFVAEKDNSGSSKKLNKDSDMDNYEHLFCKQNDENNSVTTTSNSKNELKHGKSLHPNFYQSNSVYNNSYTLKPSSAISNKNMKSPGYESINISDLIAEKTIYIASGNNNGTPLRSTFEPNEITGRSTSQSNDLVTQKRTLTVEEILASSFSGSVRNLGETLKESNKRYLDSGANSSRYSSLPKTADMSRNSFYSSFLSEKLPRADESGFSSEHFVPAELMSTKLNLDELDWQDQYAAIPKNGNIPTSESSTNLTNYCENDSSNLSVLGKYFQQRSENISDIVGNGMSNLNRSRGHALVDESIESNSSYLKMHNPENKSYAKKTQQFLEDQNLSSFSTNGNEKSECHNLSISTIANALAKLSTNDEDPFEVLKKEISNLRAPHKHITDDKKPNSVKTKYGFYDNCEGKMESNENNKENELPQNDKTQKETVMKNQNVLMSHSQINLCDTLEFNESLLNPIENKSVENIQYENTNKALKRKRLNKSPQISRIAAFIAQSVDQVPPIATATTTNSTGSSALNSPKSLTSSPPTLEFDMTSSTNRRFWLESNCTKSPEITGKLSLPNYALMSKQTSVFRSSSQCSNSSEFSHSGNPLPIKVCSTELCWGSIKLRKTEKKSVKIKNFSSKRLVLRVAVCGPGYQITNMDDGSNLIKLDAQECRSLVIKFCPTTIGLAIGTLSFASPQDVNLTEAKYIVNLSGYGGHSKVIPKGTLLGPVGSPFITLGEFRDLSQPLVKHFSVSNRGSLDGFVVVILNSDNFDFRKIFECIEVEPKKAIIPAADEVKFRVTFKPNRCDIKKIFHKLSPVMTIANMKLICGDEPTRHRVRKIINETCSNETNLINTEELNLCWNNINGEKNLDGLKYLNETGEVVMELVSSIKVYNVSLTLNHSVFDDTILNSTSAFPDAEETILYRTMLSKSSPSKNENNLNCHMKESWIIRPTSIELDPTNPNKNHSIFTIKSFYKTTQYFQVACNHKELYMINPTEGQLSPGESVDVNVMVLSYYGRGFTQKDADITIYIENEKIVLPVYIRRRN